MNIFKKKAKQLAKEILEGKKIYLNFPISCAKSTFTRILWIELLKDIYRKQNQYLE